MPPPPHCILGPPMTTGANDVWVFRIVHQDTGKPAPGVPVTVLDRAGNAEGHWVSDADGTVAIPRRETLKLRIRVGLRSEDPIELATATLGEGPTPLAAPTQLPATIGSIGHGGERPMRDAPGAPPRSEEHTSELQSQSKLVCRLLLEKKKKQISKLTITNKRKKN